MTITISLAQVGYFILFSLLAVVAVYAVIVLYRLSQVIKQVEGLVARNSVNLDKTLETIPKILDNVNDTTELVLHTVDKAEVAIDSIGTSLKQTAASLRRGATDVSTYAHYANDIFKAVKSVIPGKRK